jgi:hypothetical protein
MSVIESEYGCFAKRNSKDIFSSGTPIEAAIFYWSFALVMTKHWMVSKH